MKLIRCRDVGVDCDFEARGATVEDVLNQCGEHARTAHGMSEISSELLELAENTMIMTLALRIARTIATWKFSPGPMSR